MNTNFDKIFKEMQERMKAFLTITIGQNITTAPWYGQVPEITEAEFYDLNA